MSTETTEVIGETDHFFVKFDEHPVSPGHLLVIAKKHIASLFDLTIDERNDLYQTLQTAKEHIVSTDLKTLYTTRLAQPTSEKNKTFCTQALASPYLDHTPDGYTIGVNDGEAAGRTIPHLHLHVIPRYHGDVPNPTGGIRNVISEKGNYL